MYLTDEEIGEQRMVYITDEEADEWGERLDEDCVHDYDLEAGDGPLGRNGMFEILDVCIKCGHERPTGRYSSVL